MKILSRDPIYQYACFYIVYGLMVFINPVVKFYLDITIGNDFINRFLAYRRGFLLAVFFYKKFCACQS
jgi:hypothetical protein